MKMLTEMLECLLDKSKKKKKETYMPKIGGGVYWRMVSIIINERTCILYKNLTNMIQIKCLHETNAGCY